MWYFYLDESGDLGFDFGNKRPSEHFTISILATSQMESVKGFRYGVRKTLKRKLNRPGKKRPVVELKGSRTSLPVKEFLWGQIKGFRFGVYSLTVRKRKISKDLSQKPAKLYNYITKLLINKLPLELADAGITLTVDRSKSRNEIRDFNEYLQRELAERIKPDRLTIRHEESTESQGLQVVDLFAWGVFRKYEKQDRQWYNVFKDKLKVDEKFPRK